MATVALCLISQTVNAIPAYPWPFEITQPDGTTLTIKMEGDEHGFMTYTQDGYPIVQSAITGYYEYARLSSTGITTSGIRATNPKSRTEEARAYLQHAGVEAMRNYLSHKSKLNSPRRILINDFPTIGTQRSLVILVQFDDTKFTSIDDPYSYYYNMLNQEGFTHENGANGSARDFYHDCSNGQFDPQFDVVGPVTLSKVQSYYGGDTQQMLDPMAYQMVIEACQLADAEVDFSQYDLNGDDIVDNIYFFYAGFGQADSGMSSSIWPHAGKLHEDWNQPMLLLDGVYINRYATSNEIRFGTGPDFKPVGIGTFVHEFGHVLGLIDHYDTQYNGSFHPDVWDTMAAASYNDNQNTPPTFSAFERAELGWLTYTDLDPHEPGILPVQELMSSNSAYRIMVPETGGKEFFVIENRQQQGWDRTLPGHGALVWHIDQDEDIWFSNLANADPNHQRIDIVEADKTPSTNTRGGDPFPGISNVTQYDFYSWSHDNLFSFDHVEETDGSVNLVLGGTLFTVPQPVINVCSVMGTSFSFTWDAIDKARGYLITIEKVEPNGTATIINGFDKQAYSTPDTIVLTQLTPLTQYRVTAWSKTGSYLSAPSVETITTTAIQFVETSPIALDATDVTPTGFTAHWLPLDQAMGYRVNVYSSQYSDFITEGYDFTQKADGLPTGWYTTSAQYSQTLYGQSKPSLQLSNQDDYISFDYSGEKIVSITLWQRSQMSSNRLIVEQRASQDEDWQEAAVIAMSTRGETVTVSIDSVAQARIRFDRAGSYALLDDIVVGRIQESNSLVSTVVINTTETSMAIKNLPHANRYIYRVQGIKDSSLSAPSNAIVVHLPEPMCGDVDGDGTIGITDVTDLIDILLKSADHSYSINADVDGDGVISISDVTTLIDLLLKN